MPNHVSLRIASLRDLIETGLYQANLDRIVAECGELSQDSPYVLEFFVMKQIFSEISASLDGEPVTAARHEDLVLGIAQTSIVLLDKMLNGEQVQFFELKEFVATHVRNVNLFRADR